MSRLRFDQLAKQYLESLLEPLGSLQRNWEVPGEPKFVDLWFTPDPQATAAPPSFGLLDRLLSLPCLLEPFHNPPSRQEIRACLLKLLWVQEDFRRRMKQAGTTVKEDDLPRLWILAATTTRTVIAEFGATERDDWTPGVFFLPQGLKAAIVSIDLLPVSAETLWLRLLGRDHTLQQAIAELLQLPPDDPHRAGILQLLVNWKISLDLSAEADALDQEVQSLMAALSQAYIQWERETEQRGEQRG